MKSTGIVRRIDELGRIVIPKEMRKKLKIKDNDYFEIFVRDENIVLQKYSEMDGLENLLNLYSKVLKQLTDKNIIITDKQKILSSSYNDFSSLNDDISEELEDILDNRNKYFKDDKEILNISSNFTVENFCYIIPLIVNGDISGSIIMISNDEITEYDKISLQIVSKILTNYME